VHTNSDFWTNYMIRFAFPMRHLTALLLVVSGLLMSLPALAGQLHVVATLPTLAALAREVGGQHVVVSSLLSQNQDPHYADARPSLIVELSRADVLLQNGLELEVGWLPTLVRQSRNAKIQQGSIGWCDVSVFAPLLQVPQVKVDRGMGDIHPGGNPHFVWDPRAGARIAEGLGKVYARIDPANAATYQANAKALAERLRALATAERVRFAAIPEGRRKVVVYHDSVIYLVDWLGLKQVATVEPRPGIPPSPSHVATVLQTMRAAGVTTILQEAFYPKNASQQLATLGKAKLVVLTGGVNFSGGERYEEYVRAVANAIYAAVAP
jgi:zinc/manganese transport system substrate-binding protein